MRDALCTEPILQYPDFTNDFVITTDASAYAIGGILSQGTVGKDLPIAYTSRLVNKAEQNYSINEKDLLAIVYCVNHFRSYIYGRKFLLITDHKPLVWLHSIKDPTLRLMRWRLNLAEYEYQVVYKAGRINVNADILPRNPIPSKAFPLRVQNINSDSDDSPGPSHTSNTSNINQTNQVLVQESIKELSDSDSSGAEDFPFDDETPDTIQHIHPFTTKGRTERFISRNIVQVSDHFALRKDNLAFFDTKKGEPCDDGSRTLKENKLLPLIEGIELGSARVIQEGSRHLIAFPTKNYVSQKIKKNIITECLQSLLAVARELN